MYKVSHGQDYVSTPNRYRVADLSQNRPTMFDLRPTGQERRALAETLGLTGLRKLRLAGRIKACGDADWVLEARLGATVVQPCVVTLAPVTTRIDADVRRYYLADYHEPDAPESEMPEDDTTEPLGAWIDLDAVMAEALALNLPLYPHAPGAEAGEMVFTEPGKEPMHDRDARPFAGLAGLRKHDGKDP